MPPVKIYLDTSVPNFATSKGRGPMRETTRELVKEISKGKYRPFISATVLDEIKDTTDEKRKRALLNKITEINPSVLKITPKVRELADRYIEHKIIPQKYHADAIHLAAAAFHKIPIVVSWNFEHLVKPKTRREVNVVNKKLDYPQIDIVSPLELVGYPGK